jgi:branched-chain amino acid transport system ATP-binding protein
MPALLELECVSKSYGALKVCDQLSLSVEAGSTLGVIGPNGAGKSTLFNLITGDVRPDAGTVRFAGRTVTGLSSPARSRMGMGRSYQIPHPFSNMTVFENLLVGAIFAGARSERESYEQCAQVLEFVGLIALANRPAGSLTLLQRKRLELARALASSPKLLLLDEIGGGLTDHECQELVETIRAIHQRGTTVVWIEHIVHALLSVVDRLIVINFGSLIADGEPRAVMADARVQEVYMGIAAA